MRRPHRRYQRLGEFVDTPWLEILRRIVDWRESFRLATLQPGFHLNPAEQAQLIEDMTMCIDVLAKMNLEMVQGLDEMGAELARLSAANS